MGPNMFDFVNDRNIVNHNCFGFGPSRPPQHVPTFTEFLNIGGGNMQPLGE